MKCFRLTELKYCTEIGLFSGVGAARDGGRWSKPGTKAIYTGESADVAFVEKGYYSVSNVLVSKQMMIRQNKSVPNFYKELPKITLGLATIEMSDSIAGRILNLTDQTIWNQALKDAQLQQYTQTDGRKSPYHSLPNLWTQALGNHLTKHKNIAGIKVYSARHDLQSAIVLYPENLKPGDLQHVRTEEVVLSPNIQKTNPSVSEILTINHLEVRVLYQDLNYVYSIVDIPVDS
jgi:RES domain-containing protein